MKRITMKPIKQEDYDQLDGEQWFAVLEDSRDKELYSKVKECLEVGDNLIAERMDKDAGDYYYGKADGILVALIGADYGNTYYFLDATSEHCPEIGETFTLDDITFERVQ